MGQLTSSAAQGRIGESQFAERMIDFGWSPAQPQIDTGEDFVVTIFSHGKSTGVSFYAQVKSVTNLPELQRKSYLSYSVKAGHLRDWLNFGQPVILIVWDVTLREGRWILIHDAVAELHTRVPSWQDKPRDSEITIQLPWKNDTSNIGLKHLKQSVRQWMYPLLQSRHGDPEITLRTSFSKTAEGHEAHERYAQFVNEGGVITLESHFIKSIELSEKWRPWFDYPQALEHPSQICIEQNLPDFPVINTNVRLRTPFNKLACVSDVQLKLTQIGTKIARHSNEHQNSPLNVILKMDAEGSGSVAFQINRNHDLHWSIAEVRTAYTFLQAYVEGGEFSIEFLNEPMVGEFRFKILPQHEASYEDALQLIDALEKITNSRQIDLQVPIEFEPKEVRDIYLLASALSIGKAKLRGDRTISLPSSDLFLLSRNLEKQDAIVWIEITEPDLQDFPVELFGHSFAFDAVIEWIGIRSIKTNNDPLKIGDDELSVLIEVVLIDAEIVFIFPTQYRHEATRLAHKLVDEFSAKEVYLFGSLAWGDVLHPETDIDLAVSGLPQGQFIPVMTQLKESTEYPVDLVDINNIDNKLQTRIHKEGMLLARGSANQIERNGIEYEPTKIASIN